MDPPQQEQDRLPTIPDSVFEGIEYDPSLVLPSASYPEPEEVHWQQQPYQQPSSQQPPLQQQHLQQMQQLFDYTAPPRNTSSVANSTIHNDTFIDQTARGMPVPPQLPQAPQYTQLDDTNTLQQHQNENQEHGYRPAATLYPQQSPELSQNSPQASYKQGEIGHGTMQEHNRTALHDITNTVPGHQSTPALQHDNSGTASMQVGGGLPAAVPHTDANGQNVPSTAPHASSTFPNVNLAAPHPGTTGQNAASTAPHHVNAGQNGPSQQRAPRYAPARRRKGQPRYAGNGRVADYTSLLLTDLGVVREWQAAGYSNQEAQYLLQYYVQVAQVYGPHVVPEIMQQRRGPLRQHLHPYDHRIVFYQDPRGVPPLGSTIPVSSWADTSASVPQPDFCDGDTTFEFVHYRRSWEQLPIGTTLRDILSSFPNHLRDEHLDAFFQHGISGRKIWMEQADRFQQLARDVKITSCESNPENFLNKRLQYRKRDIEVRYGSAGLNNMNNFPVKLRDLGDDLKGRAPTKDKHAYDPDPEDQIDYRNFKNTIPKVIKRHAGRNQPYKRNPKQDEELKADRSERMRATRQANKGAPNTTAPSRPPMQSRPAGEAPNRPLNPQRSTAPRQSGMQNPSRGRPGFPGTPQQAIQGEMQEIEEMYEGPYTLPSVSAERTWEDNLGFVGSLSFWQSEAQHQEFITFRRRELIQILRLVELILQHEQMLHAQDNKSKRNMMLAVLLSDNRGAEIDFSELLRDTRITCRIIRKQLENFVRAELQRHRYTDKGSQNEALLRETVREAVKQQARYWGYVHLQLAELLAGRLENGRGQIVYLLVNGSARPAAKEYLRFARQRDNVGHRSIPFVSSEPLQCVLGYRLWLALENQFLKQLISEENFILAGLRRIEILKNNIHAARLVSDGLQRMVFEAYDEIVKRLLKHLSDLRAGDNNDDQYPPDDDDDDQDGGTPRKAPGRNQGGDDNKKNVGASKKRGRDQDDDEDNDQTGNPTALKRQKRSMAGNYSTMPAYQSQQQRTAPVNSRTQVGGVPPSPLAAVQNGAGLNSGRPYIPAFKSLATGPSMNLREQDQGTGWGRNDQFKLSDTFNGGPQVPSARDLFKEFERQLEGENSAGSGHSGHPSLGKRKRSDNVADDGEISEDQNIEPVGKKQKQLHQKPAVESAVIDPRLYVNVPPTVPVEQDKETFVNNAAAKSVAPQTVLQEQEKEAATINTTAGSMMPQNVSQEQGLQAATDDVAPIPDLSDFLSEEQTNEMMKRVQQDINNDSNIANGGTTLEKSDLDQGGDNTAATEPDQIPIDAAAMQRFADDPSNFANSGNNLENSSIDKDGNIVAGDEPDQSSSQRDGFNDFQLFDPNFVADLDFGATFDMEKWLKDNGGL